MQVLTLANWIIIDARYGRIAQYFNTSCSLRRVEPFVPVIKSIYVDYVHFVIPVVIVIASVCLYAITITTGITKWT